MSIADRMTDLDTFLVHSIAMEEEAAERHDELADALEVHNRPDVCAIFRKLAHYSRLHAQEIRQEAAGRTLPRIAPWDFVWGSAEGPETGSPDDVHYLMNAAQALQLALGNEQRACDFYAQIARDSKIPEVAALAAEFAAEEQEHIDLLQEWIDRTPSSADEEIFDTDPANMPE